MLKRRHAQRGMTLVEVIVTMTILGLLLMLGAPSFSAWLQNSRIRTTSEAILAGLQFAKSEAVARNTRVRFQLTDTLDNSCALSTAGRNWVVNLDPNANVGEVAGLCASAPSNTVAPFIIQTRSGAEGSGNITVAAGASSIAFNGLGRPTPPPAGDVVINISNPGGGDCAAVGGPMTCLRIVVSPAGQVRMCNPTFPAGEPQAC